MIAKTTNAVISKRDEYKNIRRRVYVMRLTMEKRIVIFSVILMGLLPQAVFANSSWHWISEIRPWDILPWVALATIVIEVLAIWKIPRTEKLWKIVLTVACVNLISFLLPYGLLALGSSWYVTFQDLLNKGPNYIVGIVFLVLTLIAELPIAYDVLKPHVDKKHVLLWTIICSNIATTVMVAVVERVITEGSW